MTRIVQMTQFSCGRFLVLKAEGLLSGASGIRERNAVDVYCILNDSRIILRWTLTYIEVTFAPDIIVQSNGFVDDVHSELSEL
jgi:hypothetical protein